MIPYALYAQVQSGICRKLESEQLCSPPGTRASDTLSTWEQSICQIRGKEHKEQNLCQSKTSPDFMSNE